jgi:hypothetical protein
MLHAAEQTCCKLPAGMMLMQAVLLSGETAALSLASACMLLSLLLRLTGTLTDVAYNMNVGADRSKV